MTPWRRCIRGLPATPPDAGTFDVVVVGGGIAGCCAAIAAAREGITVALIHDRPWLGGNASQEVRVHTLGVVAERIGNEVDTPHYPNGSDQAILADQNRHSVVEGEQRISSLKTYGLLVRVELPKTYSLVVLLETTSLFHDF